MPRFERSTAGGRAKGDERRRHERFEINRPGTIWYSGRPMVGVFVDVSVGGALANAARVIPAGAEVVIELTGLGRRLAKVVRTTGDGMGIEFTSTATVDPSELFQSQPAH